ncbi:type IV conjugative transfer system protein TraE [Candidatus Odyssella thessalonicensis]|uniref:type IV conjugative transfer system protein TraE n=1 Tax=Candidatus Odyssella thessalonicensis TaxID=84647 RepID=UPI000225ACDD|nr:type IV conjugative transfer system protein TraE [Candidatus Odyssella thessalonicensis]
MKFNLREKRLSHLVLQRNVLAGLSASLLTICTIQAACLFFKSEKTIVAPLELEHSFWIEGNRFSPNYLEEMAGYYTHLLLDVTPANILYQGDVLLRAAEPASYGTLKQKLFEESHRLKKENLSLAFSPVEFQVYPDHLMVDVTGDLMSYVADKRVSQNRETYRVTFSSQGSRLFLKGFSLVASDKKEEEFNDQSQD